MAADRIFGLVMFFAAAGYIFAAQQAQSGFMSDPVGPRAFPTLVGGVAALCAVFMMVKPDPNPEDAETFGQHVLGLAIAMVAALGYLLIEHFFPDMLHSTAGSLVAFALFVLILIVFLKYLPIAAAAFLLFGYALLLKPLGFILPTIFVAGIISYQISGRPVAAAVTGLGLSIGLFILFKFMLDLGLVGISEGASAYLPFVQPAIDGVGAGFDWIGGFVPEFTPAEAAPSESGGD